MRNLGVISSASLSPLSNSASISLIHDLRWGNTSDLFLTRLQAQKGPFRLIRLRILFPLTENVTHQEFLALTTKKKSCYQVSWPWCIAHAKDGVSRKKFDDLETSINHNLSHRSSPIALEGECWWVMTSKWSAQRFSYPLFEYSSVYSACCFTL